MPASQHFYQNREFTCSSFRIFNQTDIKYAVVIDCIRRDYKIFPQERLVFNRIDDISHLAGKTQSSCCDKIPIIHQYEVRAVNSSLENNIAGLFNIAGQSIIGCQVIGCPCRNNSYGYVRAHDTIEYFIDGPVASCRITH